MDCRLFKEPIHQQIPGKLEVTHPCQAGIFLLVGEICRLSSSPLVVGAVPWGGTRQDLEQGWFGGDLGWFGVLRHRASAEQSAHCLGIVLPNTNPPTGLEFCRNGSEALMGSTGGWGCAKPGACLLVFLLTS